MQRKYIQLQSPTASFIVIVLYKPLRRLRGGRRREDASYEKKLKMEVKTLQRAM